MQETLTIYSARGEEILTTKINEGCKWKYELMKEDYITVKFSLEEPVHFGVGSYTEWNGETWIITDTQDPTQNTDNGGYDYELTFKHDYWLWNNKIFKFAPEYGGREASWTWCADLATLMQVYLKNLAALGYTYKGVEYSVSIDSTVTTGAKAITFSNCGLIDALFGSNMICETWDTECWIENGVIHFGTCQDNTKDPVDFKVGVNVEKMSRSDSKSTYATRLYVFGGENNIPARYRKSLIFTVGADGQDIADSFRVLSSSYFDKSYRTYSADVVTKVTVSADSSTADNDMPLSYDGKSSLATGSYTIKAAGITLTPSIDTEKTYKDTGTYLKYKYTGTYEVKGTLRLRYRRNGESAIETKDIASDSLTMDISVKYSSASDNISNFGFTTFSAEFSKSCLSFDGEESLSLASDLSFWRYEILVEVTSDLENPFPSSDVKLAVNSGGTITETHSDSYPETKATVTFLTGSLEGTSVVCTLNPDHTEEGVNVLSLPSGTTASKGDTYTIDNILTAKVPVSYFTADVGDDLVLNGVTQNRLMLPLEWNGGKNYVDAEDGLADAEIVEQVITNDDIYPRFTTTLDDGSIVDGYACTAVKSRHATVTNNETEEKEIVTYWAFQDTKISFAQKYILDNTKLQVQFTSGKLNGLIFQVGFIPDGSLKDENGEEYGYGGGQWFEITRSDDYSRYLPDDTLYPEAGDRYILLGWDSTYISSLGLVENAEKELLAWAKEHIKDTMTDPSTYTCDMMSDNAYGLNPATGKLDENYAYQSSILLGDRVKLYSDAYFAEGYRISRVIGFERNLDLIYDTPQYIIGEKASYSTLQNLSEQVSELTLNGQTFTGTGSGGTSVYVIRTNDSTAATDRNVYSALRQLQMFLRKDTPDTAAGLITFLQGLMSRGLVYAGKGVQFGSSYAGGMSGHGGMVDGSGAATLDSLVLRHFLEVPELRYNKATVVLGDQWHSPGGGIVESCTPDIDDDGNTLTTGTITLKLEDGDIGAVAVDDICMGYFHFEDGGNATSTTDDSKGNRTMAGFTTVYFRVTDIVSTDGTNKIFKYALRPVSDSWTQQVHPTEALTFTVYGNFTDTDRQKSCYSTRTYMRFLANVDNWEFTKANIMMQFGDLSNLSVFDFGVTMSDYSAYLNNIYMSGTIQQFENADYYVDVDTGGYSDLAYGETMHVTCSLWRRWYGEKTDEVSAWTITRDSGDSDADTTWNSAHTSFTGETDLAYSDMNFGDVGRTVFTCTAYDSEEAAIASKGFVVAERAEAITMTITSSNGVAFKNSTGTTTLTARVYKGGVEQTITSAGVCGTLGSVKWYVGGSDTAAATAATYTVSASDVSAIMDIKVKLEA